MESFEFRPSGWWVLRAFSRNPLLRMTDRLEDLIVALAILVVLVATPCAAALGTAVHDARTRMYTEEGQTRHMVLATAISDGTGSVPARWHANGAEHTGSLTLDDAVKAGDSLQIWVDRDGNRAEAPTPVSTASSDAVRVALVVWQAVALTMAGLVGVARSRLDRMRDAQWEREIRCLVDDDGGRTNRQL